ncbi:MAG: amino acid-binding protein [Deferrisomatales bacterium]
MMKKYYVLSAVGGNRPGVVAKVSELLYRCGCNVEDSRMTLLGNQFSLQILVSGEAPGLAEELREGCGALERDHGIPAYLFPVEAGDQTRPAELSEPTHEVRVVGSDQAGIVYRTSSLMASLGINIVNLETRVRPAMEPGREEFTMDMQIVVPRSADVQEFRRQLEALAEDLGVEVTLSRV